MANPHPVSRKGRPNKSSLMGRELAMQWGGDALREQARLAGLLRDPDGNPIPGSDQDNVRLTAAQYIADRAFGKATQPISGDDEFDPIRSVMRIEFVNPPPAQEIASLSASNGYVEDQISDDAE